MEGEFGKVKKKSGKWRAFWSGLVYKEVGGYYDNGLKQGLWSEFIKNYSRKAQICENGYYLNDQKQGKWNYIYKNNIIGWGLYNQLAEKQGKWIELSDGFSNYSQVTYNGEYQNGKKAGRWDILFRDQRQYRFQQIGGGLYNAGVKVGMWIELSDGFQIYSKVTFQGIYKNGNKVGKWDIKIYKFDGKSNCSGGFYKEVEGCYTKMGKWIEQGYGLNLYSQVILEGEYKNGRKLEQRDVQELIGGGVYSDQSLKNGNWIESNNRFSDYSQVTYIGEYQWQESCDGGLYNDQGQTNGEWRQLNDELQNYLQVLQNGEYQNGKKIESGIFYLKGKKVKAIH